MGFGGPSVPSVPAPPPPPPTVNSPQGIQAGQDAMQKGAASAGFGATIATGPAGLTTPDSSTNSKTALGS